MTETLLVALIVLAAVFMAYVGIAALDGHRERVRRARLELPSEE